MPSAYDIRAGAAYVELFTKDGKLVRGLKRAQKRLKAFGKATREIGRRTAAVSATFAMPLIAGVKVFADFEQQMANVSTMLDEPAKHMDAFRKGVRNMSVQFGESTATLAGGLYDILSASIPAAKALKVLEVAAKAGKAGMSDTATAADAITTVLNAYGLSADNAGDVSDWLFSVVKRGKTTFAELAPSIGQVVTIASTAGVSLDEVGASLATMTRNGVQTDAAVTALRSIIASFLHPELFDGRSEVADSSAEVPYIARGAADEDEVKDAVESNTPTFLGDLERSEIEITERVNADTWKVTVRYAAPDVASEDEADPVWSFDTGGGTQHITQSLQTLHRYGPAACDMGGAIGFDGDNVQGVDITVPVFSFTETHYLPASAVTFGYKATLFYATGRVNAQSFRGFAAGEVLFLGASGSKRGSDNWEITFKFAVQPNQTGLEIGSIYNIAKKGWEYLWVRYAPDVDNDKKVLVKKPVAVYVETDHRGRFCVLVSNVGPMGHGKSAWAGPRSWRPFNHRGRRGTQRSDPMRLNPRHSLHPSVPFRSVPTPSVPVFSVSVSSVLCALRVLCGENSV